MPVKPAAVAIAALVALTVGGCAVSVTPGKHSQTEWIGTYQQQQATEQDQDRDTALRVRAALAQDPVLKKLDLHIFVDRGDVKLCGGFPDATTRERAAAVVGQVAGVDSVTTHCGH